LFALVPMLIAVRAGRWLDAVGPWRPTLTGLLLMLGGTLLPALFPYATADVAPLLVAAAMIGTGSTLTMLSVQQVVGERADPNHRAAAFSWLALGASISGFTGPVASGLLEQFGVEFDARSNVKADTEDYRTSVPKVFAAGDVRRGQSLVVWAIREGRQCARAIDEFLMGASKLPR